MNGNFFLATLTLLQREVIRFLRQKNRIIGALGTPLVFWFLIGSGLQNSFRSSATHSYLQYFFPGTVVLILLFTAIFSTISIIEDRREGFLQGVLVAPIPRAALVLGKLLGGTLLATGQGLLFVLFAPLMGIRFGFFDALSITALIFLMSFGLTGLGFLFAWKVDSTQGFHAIMNLCLMPLWLISGALFPIESAPAWLHKVMLINPLTYSVAALQHGFFHVGFPGSPLDSLPLCFAVTTIFAVIMFMASIMMASKPSDH